MILDYSRSAARRQGPARWVRALWSHRSRVELAQVATCKQGVWVVAGISVLAGILSTTHACLRSFVSHVAERHRSMEVLRHEMGEHWPAALAGAVVFTPVCFCVLTAFLAVLSRVMRRGQSWTRAFGALAIGCMPLVWFFVLLQLEGVAPMVSKSEGWYDIWNPVTNYVRFGVLMIGIMLLGAWAVDAGRMYRHVRDREGTNGSQGAVDGSL